MSKFASKFQEKFMSFMYRGKEIFKPINTGSIDEHVKCVREYVANIFFYTKGNTTIMIDAGYNYARLKEKMGWLDMEAKQIQHILITHQDTDHVGAVERDSDLLFQHATIYIGEIENEYLEGKRRRKVMNGRFTLPQVKIDNPKVLLKDGDIFYIEDIKVECILTPGHTWGHLVYIIDDSYLFTGDTIWFGKDGGYSFINKLAEDNALAVRSLQALQNTLLQRRQVYKIITGHTGWADSIAFAFAHCTELCDPSKAVKVHDPNAPYDAYNEMDDTEINARSVRLEKYNL